jgi:hypothetical protein
VSHLRSIPGGGGDFPRPMSCELVRRFMEPRPAPRLLCADCGGAVPAFRDASGDVVLVESEHVCRSRSAPAARAEDGQIEHAWAWTGPLLVFAGVVAAALILRGFMG